MVNDVNCALITQQDDDVIIENNKIVCIDLNNLDSSIIDNKDEFTCKICLNKFPIVSSSLSLSTSTTSTCSSLSSNEHLYQIEGCKCIFCLNCLDSYIKQSIHDFNVMPLYCPDAKCKSKGHFTANEVKSILFHYEHNDQKTQLFDKYLKICESVEILRNPNKIYCPKPDCQNVIALNQKSSKVTCDKCHLEFCSVCLKKCDDTAEPTTTYLINGDNTNLNDIILNTSILLDKLETTTRRSSKELYCTCNPLPHHSSSSSTLINDDMAAADGEQLLLKQKRYSTSSCCENLENIKRCPKCSILIERADGCAQIMCKMCKHTFCFYCLTSLDNDLLLKHYTKNGPCKGKLGHSRLSLLFHRFSVVAIFAGTIILIIILSPFILLSLPCLIFSRKFRKSCFKLSAKFG